MPEHKVEREMVPEAAVEKFLDESAVASRDGVLFREQFVGKLARVGPVLQ